MKRPVVQNVVQSRSLIFSPSSLYSCITVLTAFSNLKDEYDWGKLGKVLRTDCS